jgi:hypothetical protein
LGESKRAGRVWCHRYSQGLSLGEAYQQWVLKEFSGVLCVDEVYQNDLALLLAVDPVARDDGRGWNNHL